MKANIKENLLKAVAAAGHHGSEFTSHLNQRLLKNLTVKNPNRKQKLPVRQESNPVSQKLLQFFQNELIYWCSDKY